MSTAATPLFIVLAVAAWACLVVAMYAAASSTEQNDVATCWRVLALSEGHDDSGCTSIRSTPDPTATIAKIADIICTVIDSVRSTSSMSCHRAQSSNLRDQKRIPATRIALTEQQYIRANLLWPTGGEGAVDI